MHDLEEAISNSRHAVEITPAGHPNLPKYLNHLGILLEARFNYKGDMCKGNILPIFHFSLDYFLSLI